MNQQMRPLRASNLVREPGFYLGSIYVNYGLTAVLITAAYFLLFFTTEIPTRRCLAMGPGGVLRGVSAVVLLLRAAAF